MTSDRKRLDAVLQANVDQLITSECCGTCSVALVDDAPGTTFAYYHQQDQERAFNRSGRGATLVSKLYIGFGADDDDDAARIGRRIRDDLVRAGFGVDWDGTVGRRIAVVSVTETAVRKLA